MGSLSGGRPMNRAAESQLRANELDVDLPSTASSARQRKDSMLPPGDSGKGGGDQQQHAGRRAVRVCFLFCCLKFRNGARDSDGGRPLLLGFFLFGKHVFILFFSTPFRASDISLLHLGQLPDFENL
jgi:hypothetical protein